MSRGHPEIGFLCIFDQSGQGPRQLTPNGRHRVAFGTCASPGSPRTRRSSSVKRRRIIAPCSARSRLRNSASIAAVEARRGWLGARRRRRPARLRPIGLAQPSPGARRLPRSTSSNSSKFTPSSTGLRKKRSLPGGEPTFAPKASPSVDQVAPIPVTQPSTGEIGSRYDLRNLRKQLDRASATYLLADLAQFLFIINADSWVKHPEALDRIITPPPVQH